MPEVAPAFSPSQYKKAGALAGRAKLWPQDPRVFLRDVCRIEPDPWQDLFLAALGGEHLDPGAKPKLALKACKGPGKSFILAGSGWWWLATRRHAQGAVMSITGDNLKDTLWKEFSLIQQRSPLLQHFFVIRGERIEAKDENLKRSWFLSARSFPQNADKNQQANTIAGLHGRHPIVICDEVGDFPDGVVVAAEAIFANDVDARLIIAGNPTSTEGPLYRVSTKDSTKWWVHSITGDPADPLRAPRISKDWAQEQIDTWGPEHDFVKVNVLGQFPSQQGNKLLSPEAAMDAAAREPDPKLYRQDPIVMGLDIARFGDNESVLMRRQGAASWHPRVWRTTDTMTLADQVAMEYHQHKPGALFADQSGVGGGVVDRLRQLSVPVIPIDFGGSPIEDRFFDRRSEMYWHMANWVRGGGCIPNDVALRADITSPNFDYKSTGKRTKFRLETKAEMKKRGCGSPDRGDALALTFAAPVVTAPRDMRDEDGLLLQSVSGGHGGSGRIIGGTEDNWQPYGED